jgi:alkyl sulfatase BDS1-like metallo-beta-lactamase superfamily hydrolase
MNWAEIGMELRRHGWTPTRVAEHLNLPRSTVRTWFERGAEPSYHNGARLIRLHNQVIIGRKKIVPSWQSANCL